MNTLALGGTGVDHMETIARSKNIDGPFEANPANPIVSNANTSSYCMSIPRNSYNAQFSVFPHQLQQPLIIWLVVQTVGHADLFQDANDNWWGVALSTRSGPEYITYPMGRETVLSAVTWKKGEWPIWTNISGTISGWPMPPINKDIPGSG